MIKAQDAAAIVAEVKRKAAEEALLQKSVEARNAHARYAEGQASAQKDIIEGTISRLIGDQAEKTIHSATWKVSRDSSGASLAFLEGYRDCLVPFLKEHGYHVVESIKLSGNAHWKKQDYILDIGIGW